jgi:hypothetical protein
MLVDRPPQVLAHAPAMPASTNEGASDMRSDLTALSGARVARGAGRGLLSAAVVLARRSLLLASLGMIVSSCLITQQPVTYEPAQTPPIIVASGLSPDPRGILRVGGDEGLYEFDITASVLSEDAGESVKMAIYVDYGMTNVFKQPFRNIITTFAELPAASLSDGPRKLGLHWYSDAVLLSPGCHRLTLVVTHAFDPASGCPKDLNDASLVTWQFRQCGDGECTETLEDCPDTSATCPLDPTVNNAGATGG